MRGIVVFVIFDVFSIILPFIMLCVIALVIFCRRQVMMDVTLPFRLELLLLPLLPELFECELPLELLPVDPLGGIELEGHVVVTLKSMVLPSGQVKVCGPITGGGDILGGGTSCTQIPEAGIGEPSGQVSAAGAGVVGCGFTQVPRDAISGFGQVTLEGEGIEIVGLGVDGGIVLGVLFPIVPPLEVSGLGVCVCVIEANTVVVGAKTSTNNIPITRKSVLVISANTYPL
jgi:hypothetical protein